MVLFLITVHWAKRLFQGTLSVILWAKKSWNYEQVPSLIQKLLKPNQDEDIKWITEGNGQFKKNSARLFQFDVTTSFMWNSILYHFYSLDALLLYWLPYLDHQLLLFRQQKYIFCCLSFQSYAYDSAWL